MDNNTLANTRLGAALLTLALLTLLLSACSADVPATKPVGAGSANATIDTAERSRTALVPAEALAAAQVIDTVNLERWVRTLADDSFEGRGPGSKGDRMAQAWLIEQLRNMGLEPGAGNGQWRQTFDLVGIDTAQPATWSFRQNTTANLAPRDPNGPAEVQLAALNDFVIGAGRQNHQVSLADAELVFVGYGIQAPEYAWDDYKDVDLTGKVLVMLNNDPDWDPTLFAGNTRLYYGRWVYKFESAARQGAAGAIIIHTTASAGYPWQVVQTSWSGPQFELPAGSEARLDVRAWITEQAAERLLASVGLRLQELLAAAREPGFRPVPLGLLTSVDLAVTQTQVQTANVLALLPGSDPQLADEVVIYTAHHDHLGIAPASLGDTATTDRIYNGAMDNASGCSVVLGIAQALAALPRAPRRSSLLAFVGAEEQGLLGSAYFAQHPTFPPGKIAANINFDSANVLGRTADVTFIGLGKSSLDAVAARVAAQQGREVIGDPAPDQGSYYRSDQFSFARIGVPAIYFRPGTRYAGRNSDWAAQMRQRYNTERYHQPSDEVSDDWDYTGLRDDAQLGFWAGYIIANDDPLPHWYPGDEFEAARLAALQAQ